jgi:hypothetical protein
VCQLRHVPRLAPEEGHRIGCEVRLEQLDGDLLAGARITGPQDDTHAAAAEQAQDVEPAQAGDGTRADRRSQGSRPQQPVDRAPRDRDRLPADALLGSIGIAHIPGGSIPERVAARGRRVGKGRVDGRSIVRELVEVIPRYRPLAPAPAPFQFQGQQLAEPRRPLGSGHVGQVILDLRAAARSPFRLESVTRVVEAVDQLRGQVFEMGG